MRGFSSHQRGFALVALAALSFGTLPIFGKSAYTAGMAPTALLAWRFGGGACFLWTFVALTRAALPSGRAWLVPVALGALYALEAGSYFGALSRIPAAETALLFYLFPAIVYAVEIAFFGRRLRSVTLGALVLALIGSVLVIGVNGVTSTDVLGVVLGVLSAVLYAAYILTGRRALRGIPIMSATAIVMTVAGAANALASVGTRASLAPSAGWGPVLGIIVLGTVIPVWCFLIGMPRIGASEAAIVTALEPAMSVVLAVAILHEHLTLGTVVGTIAILGAAIVIARTTSDEIEPPSIEAGHADVSEERSAEPPEKPHPLSVGVVD